MSKELSFIPFIVTLSLYGVVGTIGNVLISIVYFRERVKLTHTLFIKILSIVDLIVCAVIIPYTIVFEMHLIRVDFVCRLVEMIRHVLVLYSNTILISIAIERYFAICKPLKRLNCRRLRVIVIVSFIISIVLAFPAVTIFKVYKEVCIPETGSTESATGSTESATGSDVATTQGTACIDAVESMEYCHFTTDTLGDIGSLVYQGILLFSFVVGLVIFAVIYPLVFRVVLNRSHWRQNRVGPVRMTDLSQQSNTASVTSTKVSRWNHAPEGTSANATPEVDTRKSRHLQVMPIYSIQSRKQSFRSGKHHIKQRTSSKAGTMLFVCTLIYVLVWVPFWIDVFASLENLTFRYIFLLGSVTNPIVYGVMSKQVRTEILAMFTCRPPER
ncbi:cholecystokinin receptor type A-like [Haliotis rubra]|uniref:cholecystokinin receptor type A-like n=1 Tax=Haliotis rubra TaxID=36100 RepID=UPI001EE5922A|nr:cholecystokinin receptor type A-like [Haliotis rubra]